MKTTRPHVKDYDAEEDLWNFIEYSTYWHRSLPCSLTSIGLVGNQFIHWLMQNDGDASFARQIPTFFNPIIYVHLTLTRW